MLGPYAAGCIMGELLLHGPLFPGRTEIAMLDMFAELLGSPHEVFKVKSDTNQENILHQLWPDKMPRLQPEQISTDRLTP